MNSGTLVRALARMAVCAGVVLFMGCSSDGGPTTVEVAGLRFVAQPAGTGAGVPMTISVELIDADGDRVTSASNQVTLSATGGASLMGTTTVAAAEGLATFSNVSVTSVGSNFQLTAQSGDFSSTSATFAVTAGPASPTQSSMAMSTSTVTANSNVTLTLTFRDAFGNPLRNVAVSFTSNSQGVTFTPASGTTDAAGSIATVFRSVNAGTVSVIANVAGTSVTIPTEISVGQGASALRFVTQPANAQAGQAIPVAVEILDGTGQRITSATNQVSIAATNGTLQGTAIVSAVNGVATFTDLRLNSVTQSVQLLAATGTLTVMSDVFAVTPGPAAQAQSSVNFTPGLSNGMPSVAVFTFRDAFNNPVPGAAVAITSSIAGTVIETPTGNTGPSGNFTTTITPGAIGAGTITATVGGVAIVFNVTATGPCVVGALTLGTPVNGSVVAGTGCDIAGNPAASFRFTTPAGTATVVQMTGTGTSPTFFPELAITADPPVSVLYFGQGNPPSLTNGPFEWLLPPGTFRASISSSTGGTGNFTLTATGTGAGAAGCEARVLVSVTATYTGQGLATTDCRDDAAGGPYYFDELVIFDPRPCTIRLTAAYPVFLGVEPNFVEGQTDMTIAKTSCTVEGGAVRVVASSFLGSITGPYTLTITMTDPPALRSLSSELVPTEVPTSAMRQLFPARSRRGR